MGITERQRKFAENIIIGLNPSDAYRNAGYTATDPKTVATEAYRLLHNPHISPIIEDGQRVSMHNAVTTRQTLLNRVEALNMQSFEEVEATGITGGYRAFEAFMKTYEILIKDTPSVYRIANEDHQANLREMGMDEFCMIADKQFHWS